MNPIGSAFCFGYSTNENAGVPRHFLGIAPANAVQFGDLRFWQGSNKPSYCRCFHPNCPLHTCQVSTLSLYTYSYDPATTMRKQAEKYAEAIETRKFNEIVKMDRELEECVNSIIGNE